MTNATITHWGYESEEVRRRKAARNLELHRRDIATGSPPGNTWYYMHRTLAQLGDLPGAVHYLDLALADARDLGPGQRAELLIRKYQTVLPQCPEVAERYLGLSLKIAPNQVIGRILEAQAFARSGAFDAAGASLDIAQAVAEGDVHGDLVGDVAVDSATIERWRAELGARRSGSDVAAARPE